ncbi:MAG: hypothetical protein AB7S26_42165 [Sandaracinaceae bacterium]
MKGRLGFAAAFALATIALPASVEAQGWLSDRSRTEGPGFRLGDFELHPGLGVEIGYDSNLYYSSDDDPLMIRRDSGILRATAHLLVSTRGQERRTEGESGGGDQQTVQQPPVTFRAGLSGSFYTFFNDIDRSNMEVDANVALGILPGRTFSVNITDTFGRSIRPFTENTSTTASYARIQNNAGIQANFATTGDVLKIGVGYNFHLDFFEDSNFQYGNNFRHNITLNETFRFLPQTAILHDTQVTILDYFGDTSRSPTYLGEGVLLRTRAGLNGAFTTNFSVLAMVGYAAGFFQSLGAYDQEYESLVAQVEARWQIETNTRLTFGYVRDFQPSFIGNFYRVDRGYAQFQVLIGGSFLLGVEATGGYYEFGRMVAQDGVSMLGNTFERGDVRLTAEIFAEYRFTDWLGINGTLGYTGAFTDFQYSVDITGSPVRALDPAGYNKFQAWFGVRIFY